MNGGKIQLCALLLLWGIVLTAWRQGEILDVQTLDGHLFRKAQLMSVDDGGISILCSDDPKSGGAVLRGIGFDRLPQELRVRFGYDAEKFAAYRKKVGTYQPPAPQPPAPARQETSAAPAAPAENQTDMSGQILAPSQFDVIVGPYFRNRPPRQFWFGPGSLRPYSPVPPRPHPGPRPH